MAWVVLGPVARYLVHLIAFGSILGVGGKNYEFFLLGGLLPWIFFTQSVQASAKQFSNHRNFLHTTQNHPLLFLCPDIISEAITFILSYFLIFFILCLRQNVSVISHIFFPVAILPLFFATLGLGWYVACLQVFYRNTVHLLPFVFNSFFLLTPICYGPENVPASYRILFQLNPVYILLTPIRLITQGGHLAQFPMALATASVVSFCIYFFASTFWRMCQNKVRLYV